MVKKGQGDVFKQPEYRAAKWVEQLFLQVFLIPPPKMFF